MRYARTFLPALLVLALPCADAAAQLPQPSARSIGFAGAYGARARGYEAPFFNPANLGLPNRAGWSVGLPGVNAGIANNALSYGQVEDLYDEFLDDQRKSELLAEIRDGDPDRPFALAADAGVHALSLSIGRFALGVGAVGTGELRVSSDAVELFLFGNVGEDGTGKDFALEGSEALAWASSAAFISYAHPFKIPSLGWLDLDFAVGASFKYILGHGLVQFRDQGSRLFADPLELNFDAIVINTSSAMSGNGWAFDLGTAVQWGSVTAGLAVENAIKNMSWEETDTELTLVEARADFDSTTSRDTTRAFEELTAAEQEEVRTFLDDAGFPTRVRLSGMYRLGKRLSVSGDYEERIGGELRSGWDRSLSLGAEVNLLGPLPLRGGIATNFQDFGFGGGLGLYLGPIHLDLALARRGLTGGGGLQGAFSLSLWPGWWD